MKTNLLEIKKLKKAKNPDFVRQDIHKKKRLEKKWRKPRGKHSKKRLRKQNRVVVSPGYRTPKLLRDFHKSGLEIVQVNNIGDIEKINPKEQAALLSSRLGEKKKLLIIKELLSRKVKILNVKNPEQYLKDVERKLQEKKKLEKKPKPEVKKVVKHKEESIEDKLSEEEKKKLEKKEIDKLLTKRV